MKCRQWPHLLFAKGKKVRISPQQPFGSSGRGKIAIGASHDHGIKSGHCLKLSLPNVKIIDGVTYATGMLIGTNLDQTNKCLKAGWDEPKGGGASNFWNRENKACICCS